MIVDPDFCDHWKTRMLVGLLDNDEAAPVYVLRLWSHCQNRRKSTFENLTSEALKSLCRFPGNANKLESSLVASGFVRRTSEVLQVCGWEEYNASLIASWTNGAKGGRQPRGSPTGEPTGSREEKKREDQIREEKIRNGGFSFPAELDTSECREALVEWVEYKRTIRDSYKSDKSIEKLLRQWALKGSSVFISAVENSIAQGYKGLYEPSTSKNPKEQKNQTDVVKAFEKVAKGQNNAT